MCHSSHWLLYEMNRLFLVRPIGVMVCLLAAPWVVQLFDGCFVHAVSLVSSIVG